MTTPASPGETVQLLPWLTGISRDTGEPTNDPSSFSDLRNIEWFQGAVRLRPGLGTAVNTLPSPVVCSVQVFRAYGILVWVLYDPATRAVSVVQTNLQGQSEASVGSWGTLSTSAESPPRFTMAESFGILICAHDEPNVVARLQTFRFDPSDGSPWIGVVGDLDGMGSNPILFRGVVTHLSAVWGWGFGSDSDPDRPELLRRSTPDDPTVSKREDFIQIGVRLDPIVACSPVSGSLAVLKGSSWWRVDGTTSADYAVTLVDPVIGIVGCNALQNVDGVLYWWSPFGPKDTGGFSSTLGTVKSALSTNDLAQTLDLTGPLPADLPVLGPGAYAWAYYDPAVMSLGFAFPNPGDPTQTQTSAWKVSLVTNPRWSLDVFERSVLCGVLASVGQGAIVIDPGYAGSVIVTGSSAGMVAQAAVSWENLSCVGDEMVELWVSINTGPYLLNTTVPVQTHSHPQSVTLTSGLAAGSIDVAIRHRRQNRYLPAYTNANPALWPSGSRGAGVITGIATPAITACAYDTMTQRLNLMWTMATSSATIEVELEVHAAEQSQIIGAALAPVSVASLAPGTLQLLSTTAGPVVTNVYPANQWQVGDFLTADLLGAARSRGYYLQCRVRGVIGGVQGAWSPASTVFIGYGTVPSGSNLSWGRFSVANGTSLTWSWTSAGDASGATAVRTLGTLITSSDPPTIGADCSANPIFDPTMRVLSLDTLTSSPTDVTAPSCVTCVLVPQTVGVNQPLLRQLILKSAVTHWTQVSNPNFLPVTMDCQP